MTDCSALPPVPLQRSEKVLMTVSGPTLSLPEVGFIPDQAFDAAQEVEFFADQESVKDLSFGPDAGVAISDTDGSEETDLPLPHAPAIRGRIRSPTRKRIAWRTIRLVLLRKQSQFYQRVFCGPERKGSKQLPKPILAFIDVRVVTELR